MLGSVMQVFDLLLVRQLAMLVITVVMLIVIFMVSVVLFSLMPFTTVMMLFADPDLGKDAGTLTLPSGLMHLLDPLDVFLETLGFFVFSLTM